MVFALDKSVSRVGYAPISGSGNLNCYIKSTDGTVLYASTAISLYNLFYQGIKSWSFNVPNNNYRLETEISSGTSISTSFPVNISWENKIANNSSSLTYSGGLRVSNIFQYNPDTAAPVNIQWIRYIKENGKSSGFLGDIPRYDFPYREVVINGSTTINDFTAICSEPIAEIGNVQGNHVGYSRVEVVNMEQTGRSLGKTVYDFTDFTDVNADDNTVAFPYTPKDIRNWGIGLPKRVSVFNNAGNLVKRTINNYQIDTVIYATDDFKAIKLGHSATTYFGPRSGTTPKTKIFIGQEYYPTGGHISLVSKIDTLIHLNNSVSTNIENYEYDANYNIKKLTTSYDKTRGLNIEQRHYYAYDYTIGGAIGKLRDSGILNSQVASETWITGDNNPRMLAASMTSYKELSSGAIKPDIVYSLETNKPLIQSTIGTFDASVLNRNTSYFKAQSQIVSYDAKCNPIEITNLQTGQSSSVIADYNQQYPIAKISNAINTDVAYTSFESDGMGNWSIGSTQRDNTYSVTGNKSYNLSNGSITKSALSTSKIYLVTVWVKTGASVSVNGISLTTALATQNSWSLYQTTITGIGSVTVSGSGLIDELRLHPKDANMVTYTYEPMLGVTSTADANNTIGYTEYDNLNRVKIIRNKDRNIVKRFDYSDTIMNISIKPVWVAFSRECSPSSVGYYDSLYRDTNPFSDSCGYVKREFQGIDCTCANGNPQFKIINGSCELGTLSVTASVWKKVIVDGDWVWRWVCTQRYCFSDGSQSTYHEEVVNTSPCELSCFGEGSEEEY